MILLVAVMLGWIASARLLAFHQHHLDISHASIGGVEKQVSFYVAEKQRVVEVFVHDNLKQIRKLVANPNSDALHKIFGQKLTRHFGLNYR